MSTAATIKTWKEIVAVLITLNNKIDNITKPGSLYANTQLAMFLSLRNHYLRSLLAMNKEMPVACKAA